MATREAWLTIPGYEGFYEASTLGRVRSLDRITNDGRRLKGRILSVPENHSGYPAIKLSINGAPKTKLVHHLVLQAFVGAAPAGMQCCHLDGNRANAKLENLRWDSQAANEQDKKKHGTYRDRVHNASINEADVDRIRDLRRFGISRRDIRRWLNVGRNRVYEVDTRRAWIHVP